MSAGEVMPPVGDDFGGKYWHNCDGCGRLLFSDDSCGCRHEIPADDQTFDNLHRCTDCGVTGGGVENGLCHDCAARGVTA